MAIQAHIFPDNLGLPISTSQDYFFNNNNFDNNANMNNNNDVLWNEFLQQKLLQQQLQYQQQQQYMIQVQNLQKRNCSMNLQPWKKQKLANNTVTTTTGSTISSESDNNRSMNFSQSLSYELEKQGNEIDKFINFQNERLKLALQSQMKQQLVTIIKKFEAKTRQLIRHKDDEIEEATKKSMEFQEMMNKLEVENQTWQKVALENEAMVLSLNNTIVQLKQKDCSSSSSNCVDYAGSCYDIAEKNEEKITRNEGKCSVSETGENRGVFGGNRNVVCKVCDSRNASILMLPCRHLCSCTDCDVVIDACPLCKSPKMASIEALIS